MLRIVADLGNTRLKWARLDEAGRLTPSSALPPNDPLAWEALWDDWHRAEQEPSRWALASVNPPVADRLASFLEGRGISQAVWYETAAEVPIRMDVEGADTGGADRALAVLAAREQMPRGQPGLVVSCGTAITIERISAAGVWQGGVIAPGLFLGARALHLLTAQLPLIHPDQSAPFWGRGTLDSLEAGVFWGAVGAVRELLARQTFEDGEQPWIVWTGGDAERLAPHVSGADARIIQDMVLRGLVLAAF
ncbi:MAG: type III pantothenate kinase [Isosphaeraceae bacterium]